MAGAGRVLVVDDDDVIRQLITVNLELEGFDVVTAVDGQDALEKVKDAHPRVITLDVMMPRLDGWEAAARLRSDPETAHIKVILLSARAQEADLQRGERIGVDAYLTKPFDPDELIDLVRRLMGEAGERPACGGARSRSSPRWWCSPAAAAAAATVGTRRRNRPAPRRPPTGARRRPCRRRRSSCRRPSHRGPRPRRSLPETPKVSTRQPPGCRTQKRCCRFTTTRTLTSSRMERTSSSRAASASSAHRRTTTGLLRRYTRTRRTASSTSRTACPRRSCWASSSSSGASS